MRAVGGWSRGIAGPNESKRGKKKIEIGSPGSTEERFIRIWLLWIVVGLVLVAGSVSAGPRHAIWTMEHRETGTVVEFTAEWDSGAYRPDYRAGHSQWWLESLIGRNVETGATFSCKSPLLTLATPQGEAPWGGFIAKCTGVEAIGAETGTRQMTSLIEPVPDDRYQGAAPKNFTQGDELDIQIINFDGLPRVQLWRKGSELIAVLDGRAPSAESK